MSTHANLVNLPIPNHNNVVIGECLSAWDDDLLVSAAKAGDRKNARLNFTNAISKKGQSLPRIYRITKNQEDAEDAFQEAVLRAFVHLKSFEGRSNFTSWLTRIAINSALMVLRKRRGGEVSFEQICDDPEKNARAWEPRDLAETPETRCSRRESEQLLRKVIQQLPCIFREAVELQLAREYSTGQIAQELGISLSAAKSRLMRARKTMRRRLSATQPRLKPLSTRSASSSGVNSKTARASGETV